MARKNFAASRGRSPALEKSLQVQVRRAFFSPVLAVFSPHLPVLPFFLFLLFALVVARPAFAKWEPVKKSPIDSVSKAAPYKLFVNDQPVPLYVATSPTRGGKEPVLYAWIKSDEKLKFRLENIWQGSMSDIMHRPLSRVEWKQSDPHPVGGVNHFRRAEWTVEPGDAVVPVNQNHSLFIWVEKYADYAYDTTGAEVINVRSAPYHADNGGNALASPAIQKAIDAASASAAPGRQKMVYVPAGIYSIATLFIKSNVNLHLAEGAVLRSTRETGPSVWKHDYAFDRQAGGDKDWSSSALVFFKSFKDDTVRNARLSGRGLLDGGGDYWRRDCTDESYCYTADGTGKAKAVMFHGASHCVVEGVMIRNSVFWNMHILGGQHNKVRGVKIIGNYKVNNDGINFDNTQHARIDASTVLAADDGICFKNSYMYGYYKPNLYDSVTNCILTAPGFPTVKFGWALHQNEFGYFDNVYLRDYMKWEATKAYYQDKSPDNRIMVNNFTFRNVKMATGGFAGNASKVASFKSTGNTFIDCEIAGPIALNNFENTKFINVKRAGKVMTSTADLGAEPVNTTGTTFSAQPTTGLAAKGRDGAKGRMAKGPVFNGSAIRITTPGRAATPAGRALD